MKYLLLCDGSEAHIVQCLLKQLQMVRLFIGYKIVVISVNV